MEDNTKLTIKENIIGWVIVLTVMTIGTVGCQNLFAHEVYTPTQEELLELKYSSQCDTDSSCTGTLD